MAAERWEAAILGGGPAGAACAATLSQAGIRALLIDEHDRLGGPTLRGEAAAASPFARASREAKGAIRSLGGGAGAVLRRWALIGLEPGFRLLAASEEEGLREIACRRLVIATGARERFFPFPGWTLPGVISTGAVQLLIKQGVLPAADFVVGGTGPFLVAAAGDILRRGGRVRALADEARLADRLPPPGLLLTQGAKLIDGLVHSLRLLLSGSRIAHRTRLLEARGGERLREVVTARVDENGRVLSGSERTLPAEMLAIGFGFAANIEPAQLAGCPLFFAEDLGGWLVQVDESLRTGVAGIYAAGEVTGVGGAEKSFLEGRLAGLTILEEMGRLDAAGRSEVSRLKRKRKALLAFARWFNRQARFTPEYRANRVGSLPDDLTICRCEEVRLGDIRRALAAGCRTPAGIKKATRCGMGLCQGSTCKGILEEVVSALAGFPPGAFPPPSVRTPLRPVDLGRLGGDGG
ncbi:MAG: FAD/NAD(P)-binding oxidoreductase [Desulfobacterales bacterium]